MEHSASKTLSKRNIVVAYRLTAREAAHIDAAGAALKRPRSRADYARAAVLYLARHQVPEPSKPVRLPPRRLPAADTQALCKILGMLGSVSTELARLTALAQAGETSETDKRLAELSLLMTQLRNALYQALLRSPSEVSQP